jgi:hypothetical protein
MEEILNPPAKRLRGPAGLEGVQIEGCAFTESVGKKEPRPPLFSAVVCRGREAGKVTLDVFLAVAGGKVLLNQDEPGVTDSHGEPPIPGRFYPYPPGGPAYTGPIKAAWWPIIRKWWTP